MYECFPTSHSRLASGHLYKRFFKRIEGKGRSPRGVWMVSALSSTSHVDLILLVISGDPQPGASRQPTSSILASELSATPRDAPLDTDIQRPESPPNSRSQSPDSMKMCTPEPPEPPSVPLLNGVVNGSTIPAWLELQKNVDCRYLFISFCTCRIVGKSIIRCKEGQKRTGGGPICLW